MASSTDWAWLPQLVLDLIVTKIHSLPDHVRFASVCTSWFSVQKTRPKTKVPIPMLLIPNKHSPSTTTLYSVEDDETYDIDVPSVHNSTRFCGSSHGWLIAIETDHSITLSPQTPKKQPTIHLPPIVDSRIFIYLQSIHKSNTEYIHKMILSADPRESDDYVAVAIYGSSFHLAILKSGDESWTCSDIDCCHFTDVMWHKNRIYVSTRFGDVFQMDGNNPSPQVLTWVFPEHAANSEIGDGYFVECSQGQLLLVERNKTGRISDHGGDCGLCDGRCPDGRYLTCDFKVYKLKLSPSPIINVEKIEVDDIGGDALFIEDNQCMVVGASEIRGSCLKNCICYTADTNKYSGLGHMGIFSLENKSLQVRHLPHFSSELLVHSIWVTPMISDLVQI